MENNKSVRIKYNKDNPSDHIKVKIEQDFDLLEVLTLDIKQEDAYKLYASNYGIVVGRVLANDGFGIPNAKVSIFIKNENVDKSKEKGILYPYTVIGDKNKENIRYNLLPLKKVNKCHQNVGTFPSKMDLLDNDINIDIFDEFYKYTTVTNESGDYMLYGVPVGQQEIHVDIDLSDIGVLSQAPRDMMYKGYNLKEFDSPNKFKKNNNLDNLSQIISQDTSIYVYPFWGDKTENEIAITKKTINVEYKFEPTCVFMGSLFTDSKKSGISKTCKPSIDSGKMSELITSQGSIEMIRKTLDGKIERFDIDGGRLINNDGVWCYQIPMNLDYVITDEYGTIVPTTDPTKGIPTRAEVRFRVTLDDSGDDYTQDKTGMYLIPNNPKTQNELDYNFDTNCKDTSFVNMLWNKVYTVKNYIPRIQKNRKSDKRSFIGIKSTNYHESNNPLPYNNIYININLRFILTCLLTKLLISSVAFINDFLDMLEENFRNWFFPKAIVLSTKMIGDEPLCNDLTDNYLYFVPCNRDGFGGLGVRRRTADSLGVPIESIFWMSYSNKLYDMFSCIETSLSGENQVVNFDFTNDWINGSLYLPRFFTKTKRNKRNGKKSVSYCGSWSDHTYRNIIMTTCTPEINVDGIGVNINNCSDSNSNCYKKYNTTRIGSIGDGLIIKDDSNELYYYKSNEFLNNYKMLFPSDIILIGSLDDCDIDGIPQLHRMLPTTSFKLPNSSFEPDDSIDNVGEDYNLTGKTMSGVDWGNHDNNRENGLFVAVGCIDSKTTVKTCINANRLCEIGVDFDEKYVDTLDNGVEFEKYIDGVITNDEISDGDVRAVFATLNSNNLIGEKKAIDNNIWKYDFTYIYPDGFDGRMRAENYNYINGSNTGQNISPIDTKNDYYYKFRFGVNTVTNDSILNRTYIDEGGNRTFGLPIYNNSFYFYFGLKPGKTALDLFNSQYFVPCQEPDKDSFDVFVTKIKNQTICGGKDGIFTVKVDKAIYPYSIYIDGKLEISGIENDLIYTFNNRESKFYSIKVIDGNNSIVNRNIFIPKNIGVSADITTLDVSTPDSTDGKIIITNLKNDDIYGNFYYDLHLYNSHTIISNKITGSTTTINNIGQGNHSLTIRNDVCTLNKIQLFTNVKSKYAKIASYQITGTSRTTADAYGYIMSNGGYDIIERGVCWTTGSTTPTIETQNKTYDHINKVDFYNVPVTGLTIGVQYNIRYYCINSLNNVSYSTTTTYTHTHSQLVNNITLNKTTDYEGNDYVECVSTYPVNSDITINLISKQDSSTSTVVMTSGSVYVTYSFDYWSFQNITPTQDEKYTYTVTNNT